MSVRSAQAAIPRSGAPVQSPREEKREQAKSGAGKPSSSGGFDSVPDTHEPQGPRRFAVIQGEATPSMPQGQEAAARLAPQLAPAPELSRERQVAGREDSRSRQEFLEGLAKLRTVVMERILQGMTDVEERLTRFLKAPGALGVVNLSLVISESSVTIELWQAPSAVPERRARMARTLGVSPEADDATLLQRLMAEVHEAFVAFQASPAGRESLQRHEQVLKAYEAVKILPVVPGHDTGPMLAELARVGIAHDPAFSRSLLVHPLLLAVGLTPEEGSETQVMVSGLNVPQLGTLVAQLRRVNPRLSNRQVCNLLLRVSIDRKESAKRKQSVRKSLTQAELEGALEFAYQLLRLQVFEIFFV